jgi:poly-beta-1,6-N-acetyl-D-glucosamine N-deacetylase
MSRDWHIGMPWKYARLPVCIGVILAGVLAGIFQTAARAAEVPHAVVLMYHRFGESSLPSTNIRLEQLDAHIAAIQSGSFNVWPLDRIVDNVKSGKPLPERTIGVTIDDAYASVYHEAWPRFKAANIPFTIFVSTDQVGRSANYLNWTQIREMRDAGILIGHHGAAHAHMAEASVASIRQDLERANTAFKRELGAVPDIFAYPYGEASLELKSLLEAAGYRAAFGQHSGIANTSADPFYLPRFALNEAYGTMDRFNLAVNALPLPAKDFSPKDVLVGEINPPAYGFTVDGEVSGLSRLNCFASHIGKPVTTEHLGPRRIEVRFSEPFPPGRSRINCTMRDKSGRWRWLGRLFYVPKK